MKTNEPSICKYTLEIDGENHFQTIFTEDACRQSAHKIIKSAIAKGIHIAFCNCKENEKIPLILRNSTKKRKHLMSLKSNLHLHALDCLIRNKSANSWDSNVYADYQKIDGINRITSSVKLICQKPIDGLNEAYGVIETDIYTTKSSTSQAGLIGIFYSLISISNWNCYKAGKNFSEKCFAQSLRQAASTVLVNDIRLDNSLFIPNSGFDNQNQEDLCYPSILKFTRTIFEQTQTEGLKHQGIIIAEAESIDNLESGCAIHCDGIEYEFKISKSKCIALEKSYPRAFSRVGSSDCRVIAVLLVSVDNDGMFIVEDVELALTDYRYIPVDSHAEAELANELVLRGYNFVKPLLRGRVDSLVPDFEIKTFGNSIFVELWGMNTSDYNDYREDKIQKYKTNGLVLIQYDYVNRQSIDSFFGELEKLILQYLSGNLSFNDS